MNIPNMSLEALSQVAVDKTMLATNLPELADCTGIGLDPKTEIQNRFPLVTWLLGTELTRRVRAAIEDAGSCIMHKNGDGKWVIETPRELWSLVPEASETQECCWQPIDFAKCEGNVPLNLLCLKDCDSIMDNLVGMNVNFGSNIAGLASKSDSLNDIKRRIARLSMAFFTAHTVVLGLDNTYTNILKPFHGLMQVMENPAIATIDGTNILQAFDSAWCRLSIIGDVSGLTFALNPVTYQGVLAAIQPDQFGRYPEGWSRNGDNVTFHGISFIQDKLVPVDVEDQVGEIWMLASSSVGLYLGTDLMPADDYIRYSGDFAKTPAQGCGEECTYYYNFGTALGNNANKLLRIVDVPFSGACASVIGTLEGLVTPQTLIPHI